jgi:hypothetical protein
MEHGWARYSSTKSFLSFSDSKLAINILNLGISLGDKVDKSMENIKLLEQDRLAEASNKEHKQSITRNTEEDDISSEKDSDFCDFNPKPRKNKSGSNKRNKKKVKLGSQSR